MRTFLSLLVGIALTAGCPNAWALRGSAEWNSQAAATERVQAETARLNSWFEERFEEQLDFSPIRKTTLGRKDDYDKIDDFSESARDARLEWRRQTVRDLQQNFDYALLTPEAQVSYDLWVYQLEQAEAALPFRRRGYVFHQMRGAHTRLPQVLITFHRVDEDADMAAYTVRLGEVERAIDQELARAKLAASEGVHAPRFAYESVLEQARALLTGAPFGGDGDAPLWADAKRKIDALVASGQIDATRAETLRGATETALTERFKPAYDSLIAWVESELSQADESATGVWKLPDGPAFYAERLAASTTTDLTADEIHEIGLNEVNRIQSEMEAIKDQVGFEGTLREFFSFLRDDPQFFFPTTDEGRAPIYRRRATISGSSRRPSRDTLASCPKRSWLSGGSKRFGSNPARPSTTPKGRRTGRVPAPTTCT